MKLMPVAVGLVARGVGAGAGRVRVPASVRVVRIISIGGIVVVGRSVGGRSVGAVAISRGVGRGVMSIVGGGIAAVAAIGTGRMHRRLAVIPAHVHLLVISAPLVLGSVSSIAVSMPISIIAISIIVTVPIATIGRISIAITAIAVSTISIATVTVASVTSIT